MMLGTFQWTLPLLVYAADGDGQILKIRTLGSPTQIFTSGKQFMADNSKENLRDGKRL